jgi:hypothetical protein
MAGFSTSQSSGGSDSWWMPLLFIALPLVLVVGGRACVRKG